MLNIKNMSFRYGRRKLFNQLSLNLEAGNIYGLLGKNGAGKTTLLKIIAGLLFPEEGTCRYNEFDVAKRSPDFLEEIFFLPEEFALPPITGSLFIKLRAELYPEFDYNAFSRFTKEFDLDVEKKLTDMSFGQKKKFLISFGLATNARLVILDEPTNGLDIPSKRQLRRLIASAMTEERTILISTHQVKDVENLIDPILIVEGGKILFNRTTWEISEKVVMERVSELPGNELFKEETIGGYNIIRPAAAGDGEVPVDLEMLFDAVVSSPKEIENIFKEESV